MTSDFWWPKSKQACWVFEGTMIQHFSLRVQAEQLKSLAWIRPVVIYEHIVHIPLE